jgi:hypothetical protein
MEQNTFVISGLRDKRAAVAGRIVNLRREMDKLQADLLQLDAVLKLYGLEPAEIPNKGRIPVGPPTLAERNGAAIAGTCCRNAGP